MCLGSCRGTNLQENSLALLFRMISQRIPQLSEISLGSY